MHVHVLGDVSAELGGCQVSPLAPDKLEEQMRLAMEELMRQPGCAWALAPALSI